jgi:hypothetical protein
VLHGGYRFEARVERLATGELCLLVASMFSRPGQTCPDATVTIVQ